MKSRKQDWRIRLGRWLTGHNVGRSSLAIVCVMLGGRPFDPYCWPLDPSDLRRCVILLRLIPRWRRRLRAMAQVSSQWKALVEHWSELEALLVAEAGPDLAKQVKAARTYARMQELLEPPAKEGR